MLRSLPKPWQETFSDKLAVLSKLLSQHLFLVCSAFGCEVERKGESI